MESGEESSVFGEEGVDCSELDVESSAFDSFVIGVQFDWRTPASGRLYCRLGGLRPFCQVVEEVSDCAVFATSAASGAESEGTESSFVAPKLA